MSTVKQNLARINTSSPPFHYVPVLRTLDIDDPALFTVQQRNAMRQLSYGPSVKIGIKFKSQWWHDYKDLNIVGGQSSTDRVIRTTVYPSYGVKGPNKSTVLIASYTWTSDAASIGALVNSGPDAERRLKDVVLRDLAQVHGVPLEMLVDEFEEMHSWDWQHNPLSQGAFAFFGPGQFRRLYQSLTHPAAGGYLHMAGEAISPRHAWIVGALDASWRAVLEILWGSGPVGWALVKEFKTLWGENEEWVPTTQFKKPLPQANHLIRGAGMEARVSKVAKVAKVAKVEEEKEGDIEEAKGAEMEEAEAEEMVDAKAGEMEEVKVREVRETMPAPDLLLYQLVAHGISF
ncbi:hypothetical protein FS837_007457 [Tulasnella sp. UAMH 9824]|nr:hypothetical protein FS837_007457 [Tulasnella sp. UAMH 9824]